MSTCFLVTWSVCGLRWFCEVRSADLSSRSAVVDPRRGTVVRCWDGTSTGSVGCENVGSFWRRLVGRKGLIFKLESVCEKGTKSLVYCVNNLLVEMRKLTVVCQLLEARLLLFLVIAANIWGCEKQSRWWRYRGDAVISDAHVGLFLNFWTTNYNTDNLCRAII